MRKHSFRLTIVYSVAIFLILCITTLALGGGMYYLISSGMSTPQDGNLLIILYALSSIITGMLLARMFGHRIIHSIIEISEATKEVAKGNYHVTLSERNVATEIGEMAQNFNQMTKQLSTTEILRNDFISNVSHEFKTPLNAIEGYLTLLQQENLTPEQQQIYIQKVFYNTHRLSSLTDNILQLSSLDHQTMTLEKNWFDLDEQIRQILLVHEKAWTLKNVQLDIDIEAFRFYGNEGLLAQVWQNLIDNALKFVQQDGTIRIILKVIDRQVTIYVVDDGLGMSEETTARIFEKFYQGETSRTQRGNGLGLALVKKIVELHDGEIIVSSKLTKGSTFKVTLPLIQP